MANPLDPARAAFVLREYRHEIVEDLDIKTAFTRAREIELNTNLIDASDIATTYFINTSEPSLGFSIVHEGTLDLDDFADAPPSYVLNAPLYSVENRNFTVTTAEIDYLANTVSVTVRG